MVREKSADRIVFRKARDGVRLLGLCHRALSSCATDETDRDQLRRNGSELEFDKLLNDGGAVLLPSVGRMDGQRASDRRIGKLVFAGSCAPALSKGLPAVGRAGLIVTDNEILSLHYAEPMKAERDSS
jgi:hypothetical protein